MHEEDFSENINFIKETEKVLDENKAFEFKNFTELKLSEKPF